MDSIIRSDAGNDLVQFHEDVSAHEAGLWDFYEYIECTEMEEEKDTPSPFLGSFYKEGGFAIISQLATSRKMLFIQFMILLSFLGPIMVKSRGLNNSHFAEICGFNVADDIRKFREVEFLCFHVSHERSNFRKDRY